MKKNLKLFVIMIIAAAVFMFSFAACGETAKWKVTFDYNYESAPAAAVVEVEKGERVTKPEDPVRDGYAFIEWFTDQECTKKADFGRVVSTNVTYYAGWNKTDVTVTFHYNCDTIADKTEQVKLNGTVAQPTTPEREGYLFDGWFADEQLTEDFDFTAEIKEDTHVYARWSTDSGDNVKITYLWNYEGAPDSGVFTSRTQAKNKQYPKNITPTRTGYYFVGWYLDAACTTSPKSSDRVNENTNLYAYWLNTYTFEAEHIDVSELSGFGYSGDASGVQMIESGEVYNMGASNGYYLGWLYKPELELVFNITSEKEVTNAVLALRLSAEFGDKTITCDNFTVQVNGSKITYEDINFRNVPDGSADAKLPFSTYILNRYVTLKKGSNVIKLIVSNNEKGEGGTMKATAPMVDCMYIYSDATVAWGEGFPITENTIGR